MADDVAQRVAAFLDEHHVMSLATLGAQGPHAANLFYARDGFALFWVSDPASRHSAELLADGRVAATIARDFADFPAIRGLQLAGRARRVMDAAERARAQQMLEARYPFLKAPRDGALRENYERAAIFRLDIVRCVLIDNSRGFGHKEVLELRSPE
ncbi:MAG TPA: pyridoxamine 5'-phosphate oxidase family protein [Xanthobacteraceae bacterium]|nr:pyridoxamine 5'-phosphate oxidase family protein [Xanthobacteraceae bacterium]